MPEYVKALLIILINEPLSMPISLPQLHCIFWSRAVKVYFLAIFALWQRKTSPGPILSYFHSLFLQAAQRITSTLFPGRLYISPQFSFYCSIFDLTVWGCSYSLTYYVYTSVKQRVKQTFKEDIYCIFVLWWSVYCHIFESWLIHHVLCPIAVKKETAGLL